MGIKYLLFLITELGLISKDRMLTSKTGAVVWLRMTPIGSCFQMLCLWLVELSVKN